MNLLGTARAAANLDFQARVRAAMVSTALAIARANPTGASPRDAAAAEILRSPEANIYQVRFFWLTAANFAVAAATDAEGNNSIDDDQLRWVVENEVWPTLFPEGVSPDA